MVKAGKTYTQNELKGLIREVDIAKDGQISFEEFKAMFIS